MENLCAIKTLEQIRIFNADVSHNSIAALATLPKLNWLMIHEAQRLTGTTLTLLTNLEVLALRGCSRLAIDSKTLSDILPRLHANIVMK